jgi:hypothetical protein
MGLREIKTEDVKTRQTHCIASGVLMRSYVVLPPTMARNAKAVKRSCFSYLSKRWVVRESIVELSAI